MPIELKPPFKIGLAASLLTSTLLVSTLLTSCDPPPDVAPMPETQLDAETVVRHASTTPFEPRAARVILDNDASFASKLALVENAQSSVDMLYFVFHEDYTSSVFAETLLDAAGRGVDVRLLIDYSTNYPHLDFFTMLEREASSSPGSLSIRFYNRPSPRMIQDAAYMTIGCSDDLESTAEECDQRKLTFIEQAFDDTAPSSTAPSDTSEQLVGPDPANLNLGSSGLFLSGLYAGHFDTMALAVTRGQDLDLEQLKQSDQGSAGGKESLTKLASIYWRSKNGPFLNRIANKLKLAVAYVLYGSQIEQLQDTLTDLLPIQDLTERDWRDWEFQTDYLHQKLLLVDGERLQLGGRNIGDSYHMRPNELLEGVAFFADTDLHVELDREHGQQVRQAFDRLWSFEQLVATTADIRQHAPNDFVANRAAYEAARTKCEGVAEARAEACIESTFAAGSQTLPEREAALKAEMAHQAADYRTTYRPLADDDAVPAIVVDDGATMAYLENVPFDKNLAAEDLTRLYGAEGLNEAASGKYLHLIWRRALTHTCSAATAAAPQRVVLINPYFLPPATLLRAAGWMIDGTLDCQHVTVQVLTNSVEVSDFKILNPLAHVGLKAFTVFYQQHKDEPKRARFEFFEYRTNPTIHNFTLHSKVSILGDNLIIGSANIDVRSYMMDSNNGILIQDAPQLRDRYLAFIDAQLADPTLVAELGTYLTETSRPDIAAQKLQQLRAQVTASSLVGSLSPEHMQLLDPVLAKLLDGVYELTDAVLRGEDGAIDRYNRLFKLL